MKAEPQDTDKLNQRPVMTVDQRVAEDYYNRDQGLNPWPQMNEMLAAITAMQAQMLSLQGQISSLQASRPLVYRSDATGAHLLVNPIQFCKSVLTVGAAGVATFYLTNDGTAAGTALFTDVADETIDFEVNDAAANYRYGWSLSPDKKTLTVSVAKQAPVTILGIPVLGGLNPVAAGTSVRVTIWGD